MGNKATATLANRMILKGRRIRLPLSLLYSNGHSPLTVMTYGLLDVLGRRDGERPVESGRDWLASRLGCSLGGLAKALAALARPHGCATADCTDPAHDHLTPPVPILMVSTPRGRGATAVRVTIPGVPYVDLPEWTLGDDVDGPLVSPLAWRAYAIILHKRAPGRPWCALRRADLASLLRVRDDSIPAILRELEAAGMLALARRPGETTLMLPLLIQLDEATRDTLPADLLKAAATPVDKPAAPLADDDRPHPSTGSAPHPHAGTAPHPPAGTPNKRPDLSSPYLPDPRYEPARFAATRRAGNRKHTPTFDAANPGCCRCGRLMTSRNTVHDTDAPPLETGTDPTAVPGTLAA